jgi:tetratricopeptide (TPR) repeat protein
MTCSFEHRQFMARVTETDRIEIGSNGRAHSISPTTAFSLAHRLILTRQYELAVRLLAALAKFASYARRTSLLIAVCKVAQKDYAAAFQILSAAFALSYPVAAERLYKSLTDQDTGMVSEAIDELKAVVASLPSAPTPCLLLGDLYCTLGRTREAGSFWQMAVRRDIPGGAVGVTAQRQLDRLARCAVRNAARNAKRLRAARS